MHITKVIGIYVHRLPSVHSLPRVGANPSAGNTMKREDMPSPNALLESAKTYDQRGNPHRHFEVHRPLTVEISQDGSAAVTFLYARTPDGTGLFAKMLLTREATQTLRAILSASEKIPDGLPPTPDPKQAN